MANLAQIQLDARCARIAHESRISSLRTWSSVADCLAIAVPVLYGAIRYLAKGTAIGPVAEAIWELLAAILFVLTTLKLILRWDGKATEHSKLIGENISLISTADGLLNRNPPASAAEIQAFVLLSDSIEKRDRDLLGEVDDKDRKLFYRKALMESGAGILCPICTKSPWTFTPGSCQACGN